MFFVYISCEIIKILDFLFAVIPGNEIPGNGNGSQKLPGNSRHSRVIYPGTGNYVCHNPWQETTVYTFVAVLHVVDDEE